MSAVRIRPPRPHFFGNAWTGNLGEIEISQLTNFPRQGLGKFKGASMTASVRIFRPAKTTMQSGRGKSKDWVMEYDLPTARRPEPLMGWVSSGDTLNQVSLHFDTKEDAVAFAERKGLTYTVEPEHKRRVVPRNYSDNFRRRPTA
jgi:hypothetical protein